MPGEGAGRRRASLRDGWGLRLRCGRTANPAAHDYYRHEYEVLDMAPSGFLTAASETNKSTAVAQFAIPLMVTILMLPQGCEARYALAPTDKLGQGSSLLHNLTENVPLRVLTPGWSVTGSWP